MSRLQKLFVDFYIHLIFSSVFPMLNFLVLNVLVSPGAHHSYTDYSRAYRFRAERSVLIVLRAQRSGSPTSNLAFS